MLVELLKMFANSQNTITEASNYIQKNSDHIRTYVEFGGGRLGELFHDDFQEAILKIIDGMNDDGNFPTSMDKLVYEKIVKNNLRKKLIKNFHEVAVLKPGTKLVHDDVADYFIENSFEPLLKVAKDVNSQIIHSPE